MPQEPASKDFSVPYPEECQELFTNAPIGIFTSTPEGKLLSVNPALAKMFGYQSSQDMLESITDVTSELFVDPADREEIKRLLNEMGVLLNYECRMRRMDGSIIWTSRNAKAVRNEDGDVVHYQGFVTDITQRKRVENDLREEDVRRHMLVDQSRDGIVVLNEDGSVHEANKSFADMLGYTSQEVQKLHLWDWQPHYSREQLLEMLQKVGTEGDHFETRHRRKDGTLHDVEISTNGAVIGGRKLIFCVCRDITQRKQAEQALSKSQKVMAQAEELAELGSWEWDIKNDTWLLSDNWKRIHGYNQTQLTTSQLFQIAYPEDKPAIEKAIAGAVETGEPYDIEFRIIRQDTGEVRYIHTMGKVEYDGSGQPKALTGAAQDITDRKKAEEALKLERERLSLCLESFPGFIYLQSPDYSVRYANQYFIKQFGNPQGRLCYEMMFGRTEPCKVCPTFKVLDTKTPQVWEWQQAPDGKSYVIHDNPFIDSDGTELVLEIGIDITDRKKAEQETKNINQKLQKSNAEKDRLFSYVAHDLKAPIAGFLSLTEVLSDATAKSLSRNTFSVN